MLYYVPIAIIVFSNVFYHLASKEAPSDLNPFFFVMVSYVVGFIFAFIAFIISSKNGNIGTAIIEQTRIVNWTPILLGVSVIGLEIGNLMMYRVGWDISKGALVSNLLLAVALVIIGVFAFKEDFNVKHMVGIASCIVGLYLLG